MENLEAIIYEAIRELAEFRELALPSLRGSMHLIADLGLKSLDLAHLVAVLESKLGVDPFARLIPITSVRSIDDLCAAYRKCLAGTTDAPQDFEESLRRAEARRRSRWAS